MKTNPSQGEKRTAATYHGVVAIMALMALLPVLVWGAAPAWWTDRGVTNGNTADDYTAINQGQLKKMATEAFNELSANLPGGVGSMTAPSGTFPGGSGWQLTHLINSWSTTGTDGVRVATPGEHTDDYAAVNIGQVKNVAKLFYNRLIEAGYTNQYPWVSSPNAPNDYAAANIGQVKSLFSFDMSYYLPVWWQEAYFGTTGVDPNGNPSGDGLSNMQKYLQGLNPSEKNNPAVQLNVNVIVR